MADKMGITELNEILLKSTPNSCFKQAYEPGFDCETPKSCFKQVYVLGFDCDTISLRKDVNMFESMEIAENIY